MSPDKPIRYLRHTRPGNKKPVAPCLRLTKPEPLRFPLTTLLLFCLVTASAQNGISLTTDNDVFSPYNQDQNYTMGASVEYLGKYADKNYLVFPWIRKGVDKIFGLKKQYAHASDSLSGISFIVGAFTPKGIAAVEPIVDDRPFSCIAAISSFRTSLFNKEEDEINQSALTTRLNIGLLGTSLGDNVQSYIHRKRWFGSTRPVPQGWDNQISNGGEPTLLYQIQYTKPLIIKNLLDKEGLPIDRKMFEVNYFMETNLGYYTNMAGGLVTRFGNYSLPFWYSNSSGMSSVSMAPGEERSKSKLGFFFTLGVRARTVLYNGLLQGQFRHSTHTLSRKEINPFILESEFGAVITYKFLFLQILPIQLRTAEFNLPTARTHIWGGGSLKILW